ncbi:MAG: Proteasome-associated ATPase, partial [Candidatus Woesebacteria bacterium GW2011_GWA1_41_13b]
LSKEKTNTAEIKQKVAELRGHIEELLAQSKENTKEMFENTQRMLAAARETIMTLRAEVDKLTIPPKNWGTFLGTNQEGQPIVFTSGSKRTVNLSPHIELTSLRKGQEVELNEALNIVSVASFDLQGEVARLKDILDENRLVITLRADEERVVEIADSLKGEKFSVGDILRLDPRSDIVLEKLPKAEISELLLEKVPDVTFKSIGGLSDQIEILIEAIEYPALYPQHFKSHKLKPTKGILLYGPPGCGKTLLAKAVANRLAQKFKEQTGDDKIEAYFLNVKGPELLNKFVGETERKLREIFQRAKEKASEGNPVIVFFDELDSLLRTRGSGISSDVESTIVPQFLAELDGVETLKDVIVIGASNRQDLIDPAVLRPGRFDIRIKVGRPSEDGAREIFAVYITQDLPWGNDSNGNPYIGQKEHSVIDRLRNNKASTVDLSTEDKFVSYVINIIIDYLYYTGEPITWTDRRGNKHEWNTEIIETTDADGKKKKIHIKDILVSGALIESIVTRAKKTALKRLVTIDEKGIKMIDFYEAMKREIEEHADLPNTTNPDDWAKILGQYSESGARVVHVRPLRNQKINKPKKEEVVSTGHYL